MKTIVFLLTVIVGPALIFSCNISSSSVALKTAADSTSYAIGLDLGSNMKNNLEGSPGGKNLTSEIIIAAFNDVLKDKKLKIKVEDAGKVIQDYFMGIHNKEGVENMEKGKSFLAENEKREGVKVTESGIQYEVLKEGTGARPKASDEVSVHYHGTLIDGTVFDSSVERDIPAQFGVMQVIAGWTEILQLMPTGSKWKVYIPSELAYGERGAGSDIGPNATLIFEIELLDIISEAN